MIIAICIVTFFLLALWTLGAWGLASLLQADAGWVDALQRWLYDAPWRETLDAWLPGWSMATQALLDALQALLAWLGGAAPWLVWIGWGLGALVLLALGALLAFIAWLVRRDTAPAKAHAGAAG